MDLDHGAMFATTCFEQANISRTTHRGFPTRKTGTEPVTGMVQKIRKTAFFPSTASFRRPALNRLPHNDAILVKYDNKNNNLRLIPGRAGVIFAGKGGHVPWPIISSRHARFRKSPTRQNRCVRAIRKSSKTSIAGPTAANFNRRDCLTAGRPDLALRGADQPLASGHFGRYSGLESTRGFV
jgi:hypothetical protein